MKSYIFGVELVHEDDVRWSAGVPALPGCATWGYTKEEALIALRYAAQAYIEVLFEKGQRIPLEQVIDSMDVPVVAVTV